MNINNPTTFSTPSLTYSTSNSSGTAGSLRADDTIAIFSATVPETIAFAQSAAAGDDAYASRLNHDHGMPALFDATAPTTISFGASPAVGSSSVANHRDHTHGMAAHPALSSKTLSFVRTASSGAGDQAITGADFAPTAIIFLGIATAETIQGSIGVADAAAGEVGIRAYGTTPVWGEVSQVVNIGDGTDSMYCVLKTLDADGFTVTWTKGNSGINATVKVLCLR